MFFGNRKREITKVKVKKGIISVIVSLCLLIGIMGIGTVQITSDPSSGEVTSWEEMETVHPENLIRFHVIANSDSEEDQRLKYAVRDEILKQVAPRLAESESLEESREILKAMENEFLTIAAGVIQAWGKEDSVSLDYGFHIFPTKSYGNIVLPAGEYEAVKIQIGNAEGANWWCVLFPPLCFVNVEESTTLPVDGKPGVPLDAVVKQEDTVENQDKDKNKKEPTVLTTYKGNKVGFFFERFIR